MKAMLDILSYRMPVMNFIVMEKILPSTSSAIGTPEVFLSKAQTTIDPLYGIKMPWQCGHERLIVYTHCYFYSCISPTVVLLMAKSIEAISFATRSMLIGHFIGQLAPL
jgi:hypothetical protein